MLSAGNGLDERIVAENDEIAGEAFEIVVAHPLIGESEDVKVEPGGEDGGDGLGGEREGEDDAGHARAASLAAGGAGARLRSEESGGEEEWGCQIRSRGGAVRIKKKEKR